MREKMKYTKPCLELIDFSLTSSIAGTCRFQSGSDGGSLSYMENGWMVYASGQTGGVLGGLAGDDSALCYHVPVEDRTIFSS